MLYTCPVGVAEDVPADDVVIWLGSKYYGGTVPGTEVMNNRTKCQKEWILREGKGAWAKGKRDAFCRGRVGAALAGGTLKWVLVDVTLPRTPRDLEWEAGTAVAKDHMSVHVAVTEENMRTLFPEDVASLVERAWK